MPLVAFGIDTPHRLRLVAAVKQLSPDRGPVFFQVGTKGLEKLIPSIPAAPLLRLTCASALRRPQWPKETPNWPMATLRGDPENGKMLQGKPTPLGTASETKTKSRFAYEPRPR